MNIFEQATRKALRFTSVRGNLATEQLWELPLQSKEGFDLDNVAKMANQQLKSLAEESFVATTTSPGKALAELKLEVIKHIIAVRLAENEAARNAAARKAERERLTNILANKQDEALNALTVEEITKRIAELG